MHYKHDFSKEALTDINMLLDISITQFKINSNTNIKLFTDTDIPKTLLNQNNFSKLLRKSLNSFRNASYLDITLKLGIGRYCSEDEVINKLASELFLTCDFRENSITFEIPLIIT